MAAACLWQDCGVKIHSLLLLVAALLFAATPAGAAGIRLSEAELAYLDRLGPVSLCTDPDWFPFERLSPAGRHEGIAADLIELVARRAGVTLRTYPTASWTESLEASRSGRCQLMSFLNQTPERDRWLLFTEPLFADPNVIIVRADQPDIADLRQAAGKSVALPAGTMVKERFERDYPQLRIIPTVSEEEAMHLVASGVADMTLRSLMITAHTIRKEGLFNLKIGGRLPGYDNVLRIGVVNGEPMLRDILDKGVATLTQNERDAIANRHAAISLVTRVDYRLLWEVLALGLVLVLALLYRQHHWRKLDAAQLALAEQRALAERRSREEQGRLVAMLSHEIKTPLAMIDGAAQTLSHLVDAGAPEIGRRLDRIRRGVKRLSALSECFLHKDRLDGSSLVLRPQRFDLVALVARLVADFEAAQRIAVSAPATAMVDADRELVAVAIKNLIGNALAYSPADRPVEVAVLVQAGAVLVRVRDHGEGIPPALREQLFDCYVRGQHRADIPGAGLGLYLVRRIAELHGGRAFLGESEAGAEFNLWLPDSSPADREACPGAA